MTILSTKRLNEKSVYYGILGAMLIGVPSFVIGTTLKLHILSVGATLFTLLFPFVCIKLGGKK